MLEQGNEGPCTALGVLDVFCRDVRFSQDDTTAITLNADISLADEDLYFSHRLSVSQNGTRTATVRSTRIDFTGTEGCQ